MIAREWLKLINPLCFLLLRLRVRGLDGGFLATSEVLSEDVVIRIMHLMLGRMLSDILNILVHLEGLLMDIIGEVLLLVALGARTHVTHLLSSNQI